MPRLRQSHLLLRRKFGNLGIGAHIRADYAVISKPHPLKMPADYRKPRFRHYNVCRVRIGCACIEMC
eukprot:2234879-Pleurochrysis_carterae.AAC.1